MRHHTSPNFYIPANELKDVTDGYPPLIENVDWKQFYVNGIAPVKLDVGCGKGKLLLDTAEQNPEINILGIEVRRHAVDWLTDIILGENITNCAVIWYSVVNGLAFIESSSIEEIYYLFPDPWQKLKHHKRRAFNDFVLDEFIRTLKPDGRLYLASDVEEVHDYHLKLVNSKPDLDIKIIDNDDEWTLPITNKETFCRKKDIPFYRIIAKKKV